jgi:ribose-phosphate pyrophosphokinase
LIDKRRPEPNVAEVLNIIGEVDDRNIIIVDDMIDTAGTITEAVSALRGKGAKDIYIFASHGILSGVGLERVRNIPAKEIIITDSISVPGTENIQNLKILSVANLFGEAIRRIHNEESINALFI